MRPEFIKALAHPRARAADTFVEELAIFLHLLYYGFLPVAFVEILVRISLLVLLKTKTVTLDLPDGSSQRIPDIRPIAMFDTFLKLVESIALRFDKESINSHFGTLSTGNMKRGAEFTTHMVRLAIRSGKCVLLGDRVNAYGRAPRLRAYGRWIEKLPDWHPYFSVVSRCHFSVIGNNPQGELVSVPMGTSLPQGAPTSPVAFGFDDLPVLKSIQDVARGSQGTVNNGSAHSYIDDINVITEWQRLLLTAQHLRSSVEGVYLSWFPRIHSEERYQSLN